MAHLFALLILAFSQAVIGANDSALSFVERDNTAKVALELTAEEQNWLAEHKNIRIAYDGSLPPYSFVNDDGQIDGVALEITNLLSQRLGINFIVYPDFNWTSLYKAAAKRKADVVATMVNRSDRTAWFGFTKPYLTKSLVIVTKTDNSAINNREDIDNKRVAVVKGYQYADQLIKEFSSVKLVKVDTMLDGLKSVTSGEAEAAIIFLGTVNYLQAKHGLTNLRIAAFYDRNSANESIAVRKDWPILLGLLQKGLDSLNEEEVQKIFAKWVIGVVPATELTTPEIKPVAPVAPPVVKPHEEPVQQTPDTPVTLPPPDAMESSFDFVTLTAVLAIAAAGFFGWSKFRRKPKRKSHKPKNVMMTSVRNLQSERNEALHLTIEPPSDIVKKGTSPHVSERPEVVNPDIVTLQRNSDGRITSVGTNITSLLGYSESDFMANFRNYLTDHPGNRNFDEQLEIIIQGQPVQPYEIELYDAGGNVHWLEVSDTPIYDGLGHLNGLDSVMTDITAQRLYEKITVKASHAETPATAVPDQLQTLYSRLKVAIHHAGQHHQNFILIYILLDQFRAIDGEAVDSDESEVVAEAARRLKATLRDTDEVIQFQSTKFALILPDTHADTICQLIEKIRKILQVPYLIGIHSIVPQANVGIAVYPKNGSDPADLITEAQIILPQDEPESAPDADPSAVNENQSPANSLELQQDLLAALDECKLSFRASNQQNLKVLNRHSQLSAYYQSLHYLSDYSIAGFEALIRWRHPQHGLLTPVDFIDLIKDIGMNDVMTYWIVQQVSFQAVAWENQHTRPDFIIINLSGLTSSHSIDTNKLKSIISEAGAQASWLLFSFPENEIVANTDFMVSLLNDFANAGLNIAVDNFGPDKSFLDQLPVIPAEFIEIDPYFIYDASENFSNVEVFNQTVGMLQNKQKKVVVKGIETEAQLEFIKKTGSDMVQGHLLSRALPSAEAKELMETFPDVAWYFQQK